MALTKVQAAMLSNDMLVRGVIETIVKDSMILQMLPFMEVIGTSVRYTREATLATTSFYAPNGTWVESTPTFTNHTAELRILGGDADVDNFLQATYADTNDIEAEVIANKAKSVAHTFNQTFITGDSVTDPDSFDGLRKLTPASQTIAMSANGSTVSLQKMDELIDLVKPGKPDALLMSRRTRRGLKQARRIAGPVIENHVDQFGQQVETYDGIPIIVDDFAPDNEIKGTSAAVCSSIYALKFGMSTGLMGLEHGGITVETVGELETKDATRTRLKWYCGLALMSELGVARLEGVVG